MPNIFGTKYKIKLTTINIRHMRLISLYWSRYAVRGGAGLVYLLVALTFGLLVAHILITPVEQLMVRQKRQTGQTDPLAIKQLIIQVGRPVIQFVTGQKTMREILQDSAAAPPGPMIPMDNTSMIGQEQEDDTGFDPWTDFLIQKRPALLSAIFLVLIFGMPFAISFLAFNQISGDVQSYGLRYLLLRTDRCNIYFGRFLGTVIFSTAVIAIIVATITFYLGVRTRIYPAGALAGWAVCGFLALSILMVPYIAVCSMISASVDSPFLSIVLAKVVIAGVLFLSVLGRFFWEPAKYFKYALPWGWQCHLLHPELLHWGGAVLLCLTYTMAFLLLGYYRFVKRDL
jgi:ABC-type transport system involved in multi-copper enzyme maturation permease subunit